MNFAIHIKSLGVIRTFRNYIAVVVMNIHQRQRFNHCFCNGLATILWLFSKQCIVLNKACITIPLILLSIAKTLNGPCHSKNDMVMGYFITLGAIFSLISDTILMAAQDHNKVHKTQ